MRAFDLNGEPAGARSIPACRWRFYSFASERCEPKGTITSPPGCPAPNHLPPKL